MMVYDVAIIGAGPAGIAAAIQLNRYGIKPLIFEKDKIGGLLKNANLVENFPGFKNGIPGTKLVKVLKKQFEECDTYFIAEEVKDVSYTNNYYRISTSGKTYESSVLIIASGTIPRKFSPEILKESEKSNRIFYEVFQLRNVKKSNICIVGGGDAAFDYALQLAPNNQVGIFHRNKSFNCLPLLSQRASQNQSIQLFKEYKLTSIVSDNSELILSWQFSGNKIESRADYLLFAIGREAELSYVSAQLEKQIDSLNQTGYLHLIGDVKNGIYRQTAIAVGDGIKAAMKTFFFLSGN